MSGIIPVLPVRTSLRIRHIHRIPHRQLCTRLKIIARGSVMRITTRMVRRVLDVIPDIRHRLVQQLRRHVQNLVRVHVPSKHVPPMHLVHMAARQPAVQTSKVLDVMHLHQHVQ